jgi:hypothetical protein
MQTTKAGLLCDRRALRKRASKTFPPRAKNAHCELVEHQFRKKLTLTLTRGRLALI